MFEHEPIKGVDLKPWSHLTVTHVVDRSGG